MTDHPDDAARLRADAVKLLQQLVEPCEGTSEHAWRGCKRCAAVYGVEMRFPLSIRLLAFAVAQLTARETTTDAGIAALVKLARLAHEQAIGASPLFSVEHWKHNAGPEWPHEPDDDSFIDFNNCKHPACVAARSLTARETDGIEGLIKRWRESAETGEGLEDGEYGLLLQCADELEAALVSRATRGGRTGQAEYVPCGGKSTDKSNTGWLCTLENGHPGDHIATNTRERSSDGIVGRVFYRWPSADETGEEG